MDGMGVYTGSNKYKILSADYCASIVHRNCTFTCR